MRPSAELLAEQAGLPAAGPAGAAAVAVPPEAAPWEQVFDLSPGRSTPTADRGSRHLQHSLAATLLPAVRDLLATSVRPLRALLLGCDEGFLGHQLLDWGVGTVLAIESRPESVRRAIEMRDLAAISAESFEIRAGEGAAGLGLPDGDRFDLAVADARPGRLGEDSAVLGLLADHAAVCALIAPDRLRGATALQLAGFGKPALLEPPADAERRLISFELNLMLARAEPARAAEHGVPDER